MMSSQRCTLFALVVFLAWGDDATAGLYNPLEPDEGKMAVTPREVFVDFRGLINSLRSISLRDVQFDNPLRRRYVLIAELARGHGSAKLSLEQKIALSATYLRRSQPDQALQLLQELEKQEPDNILVLSNLATAYQHVGELDRASETMKHLLKDAWPDQWTDLKDSERQFLEHNGWHQALYERNRRIETFYAKLLRQRAREKLKPHGLKDEKLDALFDDGKSPPAPLQYVGASGRFEPGRIAAAEKAKLPRDAADIVQQLLVWLPEDNRLYWQLGEIYNAAGSPDDMRTAYALFDDLVDLQKRQYRPTELVEHWRLLEDRVAALPSDSRVSDLEKELDKAEEKKEEAPLAFDWRSFLIAFGFGAVVALFLHWQIQEIRRRRKVRQMS
jgi:tetratricopeptide (TPR) repeat protein